MGWLSGWGKRIKLTIDNTKVDNTLSDFPVLIKLSNSSGTSSTDVTAVFTTLGSNDNRKKIAATTSNGTTQCYVEIERFDYSNSEAWLWVKAPTVVSGTTTDLYLYYASTQADNTTYVGDTTDIPAQNVWDDNFKFVMHMAQDPNGDVTDAIKESTSIANHGTTSGTMTTADFVDGKIGKCIDFDGSDDKLSTNCVGVLGSDPRTVETVFKVTTGAGSSAGGFVYWGTNVNGEKWNFRVDNLTGALRTECQGGSCIATTNVEDDAWHYGVSSFNGTDVDEVVHYLDNAIDVKASSVSFTVNTIDVHKISIATQYSLPQSYLPAQICEVRVSTIERSVAWLKTTYYSNWDELLSFELETLYYISGYVKEGVTPIDRQIYAYNRDTGTLVSSTTSSGAGGYFYCETTYSGSHYVVCLDDIGGLDYNDLIYGNILPATISG